MDTAESTSAQRLASVLLALLVGVVAAVGISIGSPAPAEAYTFNRSGAVSYAYAWYNGYNPNYQNLDQKGGDCTNFVSQAWHQGGGIPFDQSGANQWYHYGYWYYYYGNWYWKWKATGSFNRVRDFRSYWYSFGSRYVYVTGRSKLSASYSPAYLGDAYIFDSGNSSSAPDWAHASIELRYSNGMDEVAQHSYGRILDWRKWYWTRTSSQKANFEKSGHGVRVISP